MKPEYGIKPRGILKVNKLTKKKRKGSLETFPSLSTCKQIALGISGT
jgi:hypothetical protein